MQVKLRYKERQIIEEMLREGKTIGEIGKTLNVHRDTIYREIRRTGFTRDTYNADEAQRIFIGTLTGEKLTQTESVKETPSIFKRA